MFSTAFSDLVIIFSLYYTQSSFLNKLNDKISKWTEEIHFSFSQQPSQFLDFSWQLSVI